MPVHPVIAAVQGLQGLQRGRLLMAAVALLRRQAPAFATELKDSVLAEVPAFTESRAAATLRELGVNGPRHHAEILRLLEGGELGDFGFVRDHARLRAEHRFPLEALLHAHRCLHKVVSGRLRAALCSDRPPAATVGPAVAAAADFTIAYTDAISTIAAAAYVEQSRLAADLAGDQRAQLLSVLLGGHDESDARVAAILRRAGYLDGRQTFCVVVAQSVDAGEMAIPSRARRLADTIDRLVPANLARRLIDIRDGRVVCVFSALRRASGWTAPGASLGKRIGRELATAGNTVLIGISGEAASTSAIPGAHRQALLAVQLAGLAQRVVQFADTPLRQWMIHVGGEELQRLLPAWASDLYRADDKLGGSLVATLHAYADADMNVLKAAARLELHPNTVYARFHRIEQISGMNARAYHALTDLITVADARAAASPSA